MKGLCRDFSCLLPPQTPSSLPMHGLSYLLWTSATRCTFVVVTTLTHNDWPESIIYIKVRSQCFLYCLSLDKCKVTCIHHYGILQRISIALKIFCALPICPSHIFLLNIQDINDFEILHYLLELYTVLYVFPWLHDSIQDNFVNNRQIQVFKF